MAKAKEVMPSDDYQAQSDADTLGRAEEIKGDTKRHGKAVEHLAKRAITAHAAHKSARKELEKKTKKRLSDTFNKKD